jgi:hypothetical protein
MMLSKLVVFVLLGAAVAAAQETRGDISGTVTDPQGGMIAAVTVIVTNVDTNVKTEVKTGANGFYLAPLLITGNYQIVAESAGFKKLVRSGLSLRLGQHMEINLTMDVGAVSESVTVSSAAPLLDAAATSAGLNIQRQEVESMPVFADMAILLTRFVAGVNASQVVQYVNQGYASRTSDDYGALGAIGGNEWTLDGLTNNGASRRLATSPLGEIVEEMKVETSVFDASFGHSIGISVNQMTRSGVNDPHGSANWQYWNNRWNAANMFQRQNYYTAIDAANASGNTALASQLASTPIQAAGFSKSLDLTFGGPVYIPKVINGKNKLFFFFNYGWNNELRIGPNGSGITTVPTAANIAGDFSDLLKVGSQYIISDPLTVRPDPARPGHYIRTPFAGNIVPTSRIINPMYNAYVKLLPPPNTATAPGVEPFNNLRTQGDPDPITNSIWFNRIDYNLNEKHRFFLRWSYSHFTERLGNWTTQTVPFLETNDTVRHPLAATINWTYAASAHTVVSAQFGTNEYYQGSQEIVSSTYKPTDVGLPAYMDQKCLVAGGCVLPLASWTGYAAGVANGTSGLGLQAPSRLASRNYQGIVNVTQTLGSHTLRFGSDIRQQVYTSMGPGYTSGNFTFDNTYTRRNDDTAVAPAGNLGLSWAAFMLGIPTTSSVDANDSYATLNPYYSGYIQDSWRVTPKLTLNFGLRFEYEAGMTERYNRMLVGWDPSLQLPISAAAQAAYAAAPLAQLPASAFAVQGGSLYANSQGVGRQAWQGQAMLLPRVAAAYQINSKTVVRGGYGVYYDTLNASNIFPNQLGFSTTTTNVASNNFGMTWNTGNPAAGVSLLADPFPVRADGTRFDSAYGSALGAMMTAGTSYSYGNLNYKHPRLQRWSAGIQRELSSNMAFQAVYNGQFSGNVGMSIKEDPLPVQYWNQTQTRNTALDGSLTANVANPFYINNFSSLQTSSPLLYKRLSSVSFFTSPTVSVAQLLRAFPEMPGLTATNVNQRKFRDHSLDMTFQRRFAGGLSINFALSLNRAQDWSTVLNEYDLGPTQWFTSNNARPWRTTATGLYQLPFGKGRTFWKTGILGAVAGGWQLGSTYELQPGPLLTWPNLFFSGSMNNIQSSNPIPSQWFNINAGFQRTASLAPGTYQARVFPPFIDGLRGDWTNLLNGSLQRTFVVRERIKIMVRADAQNVLNRSQLAAPTMDPTSTLFGQSTSTSGQISRWYTLVGRINF